MSSPQQRLSSITSHVSGGAAARQQLLSKNPDDVVCIPSAQRDRAGGKGDEECC